MNLSDGKWMDTMVWILMGIGTIAMLAMMTLALGFIKTLIILGCLVAGCLFFLACGLLWGCLELRNL